MRHGEAATIRGRGSREEPERKGEVLELE